MVLSLFIALSFQSAIARPELHFSDPQVQARLGGVFEDALRNVFDINTVPYDPKVYNRSGLMKGPRFMRAGGGYDQPWTRDAAINSWNAASLIAPDLARDTLWSATKPDDKSRDREPVVQRDNQWWDKVIWVVGAWSHYCVTGDREFLATSFGVAVRLLREMRATRFNDRYGLYQGPSFFNDGISGYPSPPAAIDDGGSSFVLDHSGADRIMPLSTNCVYVAAYQAAAAMAKELGQTSAEWSEYAAGLKTAINRNLWISDKDSYGYFLDPTGKIDTSQESCGLAFAILFDVASPRQARRILRNAHVEPHGVVDVFPAFPRFSDEHPGRHNTVVWPMVQGMWVRAAAKTHDTGSLRRQAEDLARLETGSGRHFFEIYNAKSGKPDGGWQNGHPWESAPDQTWSASAYISIMTNGFFGLRFEPDGLHFDPTAPKEWGDASLFRLHYRMATLDITLRHSGRRGVMLDGKAVQFVPGTLSGEHTVEIGLEK